MNYDYGKHLVELIDKTIANVNTEDGLRTHLGASTVGSDCLREVWFKWHWAATEDVSSRMRRLFRRGHEAEFGFANLLRLLGATVWTEDENGKQFMISEFGGHYGGACDGVAVNLPQLGNVPANFKDIPCLLEMKTHNVKNFKKLLKDGVHEAFPKHVKQAQAYMRGLGLTHCLYCAVCKDDDHVYFHLFQKEDRIGNHLAMRAEQTIFSKDIAPRISESAAFYKCRFCAMSGVCFGTEKPLVNCRTCVHSEPLRDGTWACHIGQTEITTQPKSGCASHQYKPTFSIH